MRRLIRILAGLSALFVLAWCLFALIVRPSNERDWTADQSMLATAEIDGPLVTIRNVRNFDYRSTTDFTPSWETRTYDVRDLDSVWFVVEPFGGWDAMAHTFVSFGFAGEKYVAISVEIRKERGESFSPFRGLLRQYELMYVIGDERDLIGLRANHRKDEVYLYPVRATPDRAREMFLGMLGRANDLAAEPEFYNTLTNTCTTNLVAHVNQIAPGRIPLSAGVILPGYSDDLAWELGLIDTELPRERIRERFRINDDAGRWAGHADFSRMIRSDQVFRQIGAWAR